MIARVRSVTLRAASAGSMFSVTGSMSQNTGVAPHLRDRLRRGVERERRAEDLVAGPDLERLEAEHDRVRAVPDADRVRHAEPRRRLLLEGADVRPEDEHAGVENVGEPLLQLGDQGRVLRPHVNERDPRHADSV